MSASGTTLARRLLCEPSVALLGEFLILPRLWPCVIAYVAGTVTVLIEPELTFVAQAVMLLTTASFFARALMLHAAESRVGAAR